MAKSIGVKFGVDSPFQPRKVEREKETKSKRMKDSVANPLNLIGRNPFPSRVLVVKSVHPGVKATSRENMLLS